MGKESACNAGDPSWISGSGRSPGEGIGYPLQYSWASLVAQMIKNLPTMSETWVQSLGWENPLQKGTATHSSILAWRIPWTEETGRLQSVGLHSHSDIKSVVLQPFSNQLSAITSHLAGAHSHRGRCRWAWGVGHRLGVAMLRHAGWLSARLGN